jgi:Icc protein
MDRMKAVCFATALTTMAFFCARGVNALPVHISGVVFQDTNGNGRQDHREPGLPDVVLSDGVEVIRTDGQGQYHLLSQDSRVLFVCLPGSYRANGDFYEYLRDHQDGDSVDFPMLKHPFCDDVSFLFFTDSHVTSEDRFNAIAGMKAAVEHMNGQQAALVISGGDLIMDALGTCESEVRDQFELYRDLISSLRFPLYNAIGNHEHYGVYLEGEGEDSCIVKENDPLYGVGFYREYLGPDYYAFNWGPYHFMVLNTIGLTNVLNEEGDTARVYYGNVGPDQIAWMEKDLAAVGLDNPIILIGHIPFMTAVHTFEGYSDYQIIGDRLDDPQARSYTHVVSNAAEVINGVLADRHLILALAGHHHHYEAVRWADSQHDATFAIGGSVCGQWWQGDRRIAGSTWPEGYLKVSLQKGKISDLQYISFHWRGYKE